MHHVVCDMLITMQVDDLVLAVSRRAGTRDGATALVVLRLGGALYSAHAGDSRAVLCRDGEAHRLTEDHKPHLPQVAAAEVVQSSHSQTLTDELHSVPCCVTVGPDMSVIRVCSRWAASDRRMMVNIDYVAQHWRFCCQHLLSFLQAGGGPMGWPRHTLTRPFHWLVVWLDALSVSTHTTAN
jgi:hypothetical protein